MFVLCQSFQHSLCFPVHCFCYIVTSERLSVAAPFATALMAKVHLIKRTHTHSLLPSATYPLWWSAIQFVSQLQPSLLPKAHSSKWICLTFWPCSSLYDVCGLLGNNHLITTRLFPGLFELMVQPTWLHDAWKLLSSKSFIRRMTIYANATKTLLLSSCHELVLNLFLC